MAQIEYVKNDTKPYKTWNEGITELKEDIIKEIKDWATGEFADKIQKWVCEEFASEVEMWTRDTFVAKDDEYNNELKPVNAKEKIIIPNNDNNIELMI